MELTIGFCGFSLSYIRKKACRFKRRLFEWMAVEIMNHNGVWHKRKIGKVERQMALSRKTEKAFLTAAVTAGVYLSFRYLLPLIFPFLAAYLMALLLQPSAAFLEKRLRISFRGRMIGVPRYDRGRGAILLSIFLMVCWQQDGVSSRRSWNTF